MNNPELHQILAESGSAIFYTPPAGKIKAYSWIFSNPVEIMTAADKISLKKITGKAENLINAGFAGFVIADYESAYLLEKKLTSASDKLPVSPVKIFIYKPANTVCVPSQELGLFNETGRKDYSVSGYRLNIQKREYIHKAEKIRELIEEGETYQVNFTVKGKFNFKGNPVSLFSRLLFNQSAPYAAIINTEDKYIISVSPELFFSLEKNKIITRPMKGTLKNDFLYGSDDITNAEWLRNSAKEISENLMIVDLLRNDLGKICKFGSVKVKKLFEVEKYESLYQMVSEIHGETENGITLFDIFNNIFPCGSVTGAPKLRTMQIIKELENENRGIYTGSIGLLLKNKKVFNVAIRTLSINKKTGEGEIGLGSGIVWDSNPPEEYKEVQLKSNFLTHSYPMFRLLETMLLKDGKILFLQEHFKRLESSSKDFLFDFNIKKINTLITKTTKNYQSGEFKVRLLLSKEGNIKVEINLLNRFDGEIKIAVSAKKNNSSDKFLYHKTTNRKYYDNEYRKYSKKGFFDVIFFNERDELCEGAISNIFIRKNNRWYTPEISSGLLPGIYRQFLLNNLPNVSETKILYDDLLKAGEVILVNSLRGKTGVDKIYLPDGNSFEFKSKKEFLLKI